LGKPLVIVESPAKARTIGKFLGRDYVVKASMGHVRDLPRSGLAVYPERGFEADWEPIKDRAKVVAELRKHLAGADEVWLATDPDREGEAIAWHLVELLLGAKGKGKKVQRVHFHEITAGAIREAFEHPGEVNGNLVDAYRARRILDRLVGYQLSELLWKKLTRGLSAGRVQSVAVKLVVDREREIRAFVPEEYWKIVARFEHAGQAFEAEFRRLDGKAKELKNADDARAVLQRVARLPEADARNLAIADVSGQVLVPTGPFTVTGLKQAPRRVSAKPPFKTSTLQQAAAGRYGFAAKRTMRIAQQLYEGIDLPGEGAVGLITYMRTDSFNIAATAREAARKLVLQRWGERFLPEKPNVFRSKESAQEAHEAIRPTDPFRTPESLRGALNEEQVRLYELIWRRFIACQMAPAEYLVTTLELVREGAAFAASGRVTTFAGFTQVYGAERDDEQPLPPLQDGQQLPARAVVPARHFTTPPRRYTEASLVKALEEFGIGRPSTYASILSTIVDRKYVDHGEEAEQERLRRELLNPQAAAKPDVEELAEAEEAQQKPDAAAALEGDDEEVVFAPRQKRKTAFHATHLGEVTTDLLEPQFSDIVNTAFTAKFEDDLDAIAEGQAKWQDVVGGFYDRFTKDLAAARDGMGHYRANPLAVPDMTCNRVDEKTGVPCGAPMVVLFNRGGAYLGCSRYPDCSNNLPLSGQRAQAAELTEFRCQAKDATGQPCGRPMEKKVNRWGRPFLACTGFKAKECRGAVSLSTKGEPLWPVETSVPCPLCGRTLNVKRSRRGKFLACPGYPKCRGTLNLPACPHESRGGTVCGLPMTEPGPAGTMACREHPQVTLAPPAKAPREAQGGQGEGGDSAGDAGVPKQPARGGKAGAGRAARKTPARSTARRPRAKPKA
jgi:DNA topoisomerase-1